MKNTALLTLSATLLAACTSTQTVNNCSYNKEELLALDEQAFDQDLSAGGRGWRAVAKTPGCELVTADLLADYRSAHPSASTMINWHEGQMRASAGDYEQAIPLLASAKSPPDHDKVGWNAYVDATIAFLEGNKPGLLDAHNLLAAVSFPQELGLPPPINGYIEFPSKDGQPAFKVRWPFNIEVVEGLITCFEKPYSEAYGSASCRHTAP